jgi:hypothetical protein
MKTKLIEYIEENCTAVDTEKLYDEMLDESYSFDSVGGSFKYLSPSTVLKEMCPTDYRCGKVDYLDSLGTVEIGDGEYMKDDVSDACDGYASSLDDELSDLETEYEESKDEDISAQIVEKLKEIADTAKEIKELI